MPLCVLQAVEGLAEGQVADDVWFCQINLSASVLKG